MRQGTSRRASSHGGFGVESLEPRRLFTGFGPFGVVFHDVNGDGVRDQGEAGLAGWRVYVDRNDNGRFEPSENSTLTDAGGNYQLENLPVGDNHIREVPQDGWRQTSPAEGFYHFNPAQDIAPHSQDFGNVQQGFIAGSVYYDRNLNGEMDGDDPLMDAIVFDDVNRNGALDSDEPFRVGSNYGFALDEGVHSLRVIPPAGFQVVSPRGGAIDATIVGASVQDGVDFTLYPKGAVPRLFYNDSAFDGSDAAATTSDDKAIAPDKIALRPGERGTFDNVSSFKNGINGVMIDLPPRPGGPTFQTTLNDFSFHSGRGGDPVDWSAGPAPITIDVRPGAGVTGGDRVTLIWKNFNPLDMSPIAQAMANGWLQVMIKPSVRTNLTTAQTFYFGDLIGEAGDNESAFAVTAPDLTRTRNAIGAAGGGLTSRTDFNRDGRTDAADLVIVRNNVGLSLPAFKAPIDSLKTPSVDVEAIPLTFSETSIDEEKKDRAIDALE